MDYVAMNDQTILQELGERVRRERLNQNMTQIQLAEFSGVSRTVVQNLEHGRGCTLEGFIRILRGLDVLDQLDTFLPDPGISPIQLARMHGYVRERASGYRAHNKSGHA